MMPASGWEVDSAKIATCILREFVCKGSEVV